jgi:hypothetical protein
MKKYTIPPELVDGFRMCEALHSKENWAVYIALMEEGDTSMSKLSSIFGGTYHELALILDELEKGGLVEMYTIWDDEIGGDLGYYIYRTTIAGYRFYARLFDAIIPTSDITRWKKAQVRTQKALNKLRGKTT